MLTQKRKRSEDWSPGECATQVWSCHSGLIVSQMYWYTAFALPSLLLAPVPSVHYYHSCSSSAPIPQSSLILCSQAQHPFQVTDLPLDPAPLPLQPLLPPFLAPGDLQVYWAACSSLTKVSCLCPWAQARPSCVKLCLPHLFPTVSSSTFIPPLGSLGTLPRPSSVNLSVLPLPLNQPFFDWFLSLALHSR